MPSSQDVITAMKEIAAALQSANREEAERAFQERLLAEFTQIRIQLERMRQLIVEMGVLLAEQINNVNPQSAEIEVYGSLSHMRTVFPALRHDQDQSIDVFQDLNTKTGTAALYGPGLVHSVALGFVGLRTIYPFTRQPPAVFASLNTVYAEIFRRFITGSEGALTTQIAVVKELLARVDAAIADFDRHGERPIGKTDASGTLIVEQHRRGSDGYFEYSFTTRALERRRPRDIDHERGPRFTDPERIEILKILQEHDEHEESSKVRTIRVHPVRGGNPVPESELIFYVRGVRQIPTDAGASSAHDPNRDQHQGEWENHIVEHERQANICVGLRQLLQARVEEAARALDLAVAMLALAESRSG